MNFESTKNLTAPPDRERDRKLLAIGNRMERLAAKVEKEGGELKGKSLDEAIILVNQMGKVFDEEYERRNAIISVTTKEGKKIEFDLKEQLEYYRDFYQKTGVDWVHLPETIKITKEQQKEMERLITELGFDHMIIIPEGLVGETKVIRDASGKVIRTENERYAKLHKLMSEGFNETWRSSDYKADGDYEGSVDTNLGFRIILTKDVQELDEDELSKKTLCQSVKELEAPGGIFKKHRVHGLSESEYLVYQMEYYFRSEKTKHLDVNKWTWLPGSGRPLFGRVPRGLWDLDDTLLRFYSFASDGHRDVNLGCRLSGTFNI